MPRIVEERHPKELWLLYFIGNLTAIYSEWVVSLAFVWLYTENGTWKLVPKKADTTSLFYNGVFFFRYTLVVPLFIAQLAIAYLFSAYWVFLFGVFLGFRWSASTTKKALFQTGLGYKLNGRLGAIFRFQSDKSSEEGVTGKNFGQKQGSFDFGCH